MPRFVGYFMVLALLLLVSKLGGETLLQVQVNGAAYTGQALAEGDAIDVTWHETEVFFGGFSSFELTVAPANYVANSFALSQPASWLGNTLTVNTPVGDGFTISGGGTALNHPLGDIFSVSFTVPGGLVASDVIMVEPTDGVWLGILFTDLPSAELPVSGGGGCGPVDPNAVFAISKWKVKAGKDRMAPLDRVAISGMFSATADQFDEADQIQVVIETDSYAILDETVTVTQNHLKKGKIQYKGDGVVRAITLDFAKGKFAVQIKGADLSGLSSPATLKLQFGCYADQGQADETVLNGKKPLDLCLMHGVEDVLRMDKVKIKEVNTGDNLMLKGAIADGDMVFDLPNEEVTIQWGSYSETIDKQFVEVKPGFYLYVNKKPGNGKFVTALLVDLNKCKLKLMIKNTVLDKQGDVVFAINADGFSAQTTVTLE